MKVLRESSNQYLAELKNRSEKSRVHKRYQLVGLEVAAILGDPEHKSLYMKLAKKHGENKILQIAKEVAERGGVKNKGGYFMTVFLKSL